MPLMAETNPVYDLIELFKGLRPMLRAIGEKSPNLIQTWLKAGSIPHWREDQIRRAVREKRIKNADAVLLRIFPPRDDAEAA